MEFCKTNIVYFLIILVCFGCTKTKKANKILEKQIATLKDDCIIFPNDMIPFCLGNEYPDTTLLDRSFKMIVYIDKEGCTNCKLRSLIPLYMFMTEYRNLENFGVIIILNTNNIDSAKQIIKEINFSATVFFDLNNSFKLLNPHIPQEERLQTFLINENGHVLLVGSPIRNSSLRDLYLEQITGLQNQEASPKTILEMDKVEYDLGTVKEGNTKKQIITVRNTGISVFKLKGFTTSCDCTEATCDWKELQPGESGTVTVSYEAEQPGDFYRTVEIYGNIPNNSLMVSFIGTVE